ncbi:hypothetical protein [Micromonospora chalcea]|uniref:hypothetical protein n=1 Tax=Micromonospora chalcea TaxID=1874 RepID=UPI003D9E0D4D
MGKKTIHVSDFTGQVLSADDEVVKVVVLEHPDLVAGPVQLDATPVDVESIDDAALDVAVVEIHDRHGHGEPRRVVLTASEFDAMATDVPMAQLPAPGPDAARRGHAAGALPGRRRRGGAPPGPARRGRAALDPVRHRRLRPGVRPLFG